MSALSIEGNHYGSLPPSVRNTRQSENRYHHRQHFVDTEKPSLPSLFEEIAEIRRDPQKEGIYLLPGTGFQVGMQADLLIENLQKGVPFQDVFQQVEQDIQAFKIEYLCEGPVFPILLEKKNVEGRDRLTGKLYGGKSWVDSTSSIERKGVVKESVQKMEDFLLQAEPGSMAVLISPRGWNNYQINKEGRLEAFNSRDIASNRAVESVHPDQQVYGIQVLPDKTFKGFTLKADMDISQSVKLANALGANIPLGILNQSEEMVVTEVVDNVLLFNAKDNKNIDSIRQTMQQIKGSSLAFTDTTGAARTFEEMADILKNPEPLWTLDQTTQGLTDGLREYLALRMLHPDQNLKRDVEVAFGIIVLKLMHEIRSPERSGVVKMGVMKNISEAHLPLFDPAKVLNQLQKVGGCSGGGNKDFMIMSASPRKVEPLKNIFDKEHTCDKCNESNLDNHYHCDNADCGKKYASEINTNQSDRTPKCESCGKKFGCGDEAPEQSRKPISIQEKREETQKKEHKEAA